MFLFSFGQESETSPAAEDNAVSSPLAPCRHIALDADLLEKHIQVIGEVVPTMAGSLLKRNVADIKFEIAETDDLEDGNLLANVVVSQTDLIPGVYEGGLKTWECAVDLVNYLASLDPAELHGKRVIELGCGSSLPGIFCLTQDAVVDFQDYNEDVLRLVTIPNVLLNTTQRPSNPPTHTSVTFDAELDFSTLSNIPSRFWAGDWGSLKETLATLAEDDKYDIVLTSETIYASESHARLLDLIQATLKTDGVL